MQVQCVNRNRRGPGLDLDLERSRQTPDVGYHVDESQCSGTEHCDMFVKFRDHNT